MIRYEKVTKDVPVEHCDSCDSVGSFGNPLRPIEYHYPSEEDRRGWSGTSTGTLHLCNVCLRHIAELCAKGTLKPKKKGA